MHRIECEWHPKKEPVSHPETATRPGVETFMILVCRIGRNHKRTGGAQHHPASASQLRVALFYGAIDCRDAVHIPALFHLQVNAVLWVFGHAPAQLSQRFVGSDNGIQHMHGGHQAIARCRRLTADQMAGRLTARVPVVFQQQLINITVTHLGPNKRYLSFGQGQLHAQVGHLGAHHAPFQDTFGLLMHRHHRAAHHHPAPGRHHLP